MLYHRKVIRITAEQSPNVRLAQAQIAKGLPVTGEVLVPGVLSWEEYQRRRATWDPIRACIGLDAKFYQGKEQLLYPPQWLTRAEEYARTLLRQRRIAVAIGIDPGEGVANTAMCSVDEYGVVDLVSSKTPDTSVIIEQAIGFMRKHNVPPEMVVLDRGGGGKQLADILRSRGFPVRTVAFGESVMLDPKRGLVRVEERLDTREERYAYVNRRAEMYDELRQLLDPSRVGKDGKEKPFAIPAEYIDLRHQLAPIPLRYDGEGRLKLPPKNKRDGQGEMSSSKEQTMTELCGRSPDEADALVLAIHGMLHRVKRAKAGVS